MKLTPRMALIWVFLLSACVSAPPYLQSPMLEPGPADQKLMQSLSTRYAHDMKLVHRLVITARGKQYDMTGYLLYRQPDHFYAAAYVEAGAPIFELVHSDGKGKVLRKPTYMPEVLLRNGIMDDLIHIFSNKNPIEGKVISRSDESSRFAFPRGNGFIQEYLLNSLGTVFSSKTAHQGKLIRSVRYSGHKSYGELTLPEMTYLENYRVKYQLSIQLVEASTEMPAKFNTMLERAR